MAVNKKRRKIQLMGLPFVQQPAQQPIVQLPAQPGVILNDYPQMEQMEEVSMITEPNEQSSSTMKWP